MAHKNDTLSDYVFQKAQPQATELEEAVLGAMLLEKDAYFLVRDIISPETTYAPQNTLVFKAMDRLVERGDPIDLLTVMTELQAMGQLENAGGAFYLTTLTDRVASSANIEKHARVVKEKWIARELIKTSSQIIRSCYENDDVFEILKDLDKSLIKILDFKKSTQSSLFDAAMEMHRLAMLRRDTGSSMVGFPIFGIPELDNSFSGLEPGDLLVVAGRPQHGKSSLLSNAISQCMDKNEPLYVWAGETPKVKTATRVTSMRTGIGTRVLESGKYEVDQIDPVIQEMKKRNIILETGAMDIATMRRTVVTLNKMHNIRFFAFDRTELFSNFRNARGQNDKIAAVGDITAEMRNIATDLGVAFILVAQLKQDAEGRRPESGDVWGGTGAQANPTKMLGCYIPSKHGVTHLEDGTPAAGKGEVVLFKANYDKGDTITLGFNGACQHWHSLNPELPASIRNPSEPDVFDQPFEISNVITRPSKMNENDDLPF